MVRGFLGFLGSWPLARRSSALGPMALGFLGSWPLALGSLDLGPLALGPLALGPFLLRLSCRFPHFVVEDDSSSDVAALPC